MPYSLKKFQSEGEQSRVKSIKSFHLAKGSSPQLVYEILDFSKTAQNIKQLKRRVKKNVSCKYEFYF